LVKFDLWKVKLWLLVIVMETSSHVALYDQLYKILVTWHSMISFTKF